MFVKDKSNTKQNTKNYKNLNLTINCIFSKILALNAKTVIIHWSELQYINPRPGNHMMYSKGHLQQY